MPFLLPAPPTTSPAHCQPRPPSLTLNTELHAPFILSQNKRNKSYFSESTKPFHSWFFPPEFGLHFCLTLKHSGPVRYHTRASVSGSFGYTMIRLTATRGNIQPLFGSLLSSYTQHSYFSTRSFNHSWPPFFKSKNSLSMRDCLLNISLVSF